MREKLEQLLKAIELAERNTEDIYFQEAIRQALILEVVSLVDAAKGLRVSLTKVNRWCMGFDVPHPVDRPVFLWWLKGRTEAKISAQTLAQLFKTIEEAERNPEDEKLFHEAVGQTLRLGVVSLLEAARGLRVSLPTVNRWCMGQSAPHPIGRSPLLRWMKERVEEKLRQ